MVALSWYLDEHGNNTTLWPSFTFTFRHLTRQFDLAAYRTTALEDREVFATRAHPGLIDAIR